jgi:hypothetical protein
VGVRGRTEQRDGGCLGRQRDAVLRYRRE